MWKEDYVSITSVLIDVSFGCEKVFCSDMSFLANLMRFFLGKVYTNWWIKVVYDQKHTK